jgi:hypothetical protein
MIVDAWFDSEQMAVGYPMGAAGHEWFSGFPIEKLGRPVSASPCARSRRWIVFLRWLQYRDNHLPIAVHAQFGGLPVGKRQAGALKHNPFVSFWVNRAYVVVRR